MAEATAVRGPASRSGLRLYRLKVANFVQLSAHMRRITLAGGDLDRFVSEGPDQRIKVLLPRAGQAEPVLADDITPRGVLQMPADIQPVMRTYTVRHHRQREIDVDFVLHPDGGPASRWAASARIGDAVAIYGPVSAYAPPEGCQFQLLVGDETAVPAIGAIVEQLPAGVRAEVLVAGDEQQWSTAGSVRVRWMHPDALCAAVSTVDIPALSTKYAWVAGEQSVVRAIRAFLVDNRGFARDQVYFSGYWRRGKSENED